MFRQSLQQNITELEKNVKSKNIDDIKSYIDEYDKHYTELYKRYFEIYERTNNKDWYIRSYKTEQCGSYLEFALFENAGLKLINANFCKDRLCLMCNWRRSLRTYSKVANILDYLTNQSEKKYRFLFLTLTIRNCEPDELNQTINDIFYAFNKFTKNKRIKRAVKGFFRALEITINDKDRTFHPHLHCILAVNNSYFKDTKQYITQSEFTDIWQASANINYKPIVNIKPFRNNKGVAEATKYCIKLDEAGLKKITLENLELLRNGIANRRLVGLGGVIRQAAALLKMDINDDKISEDYLTDDDIKNDTLIAILRFFHTRDKTKGYQGFVIKEIEPIGF